jgi:hypothetical protein
MWAFRMGFANVLVLSSPNDSACKRTEFSHSFASAGSLFRLGKLPLKDSKVASVHDDVAAFVRAKLRNNY